MPPITPDDAEFLRQFEDATIPAFHHAEHVRVAWLYLRQMSVLEALTRFTTSLQRFAAAKGKPGLYHETITWAFFFLIHERMTAEGAPETWEQFAAAHPDLVDWKNNILHHYYDEATLKTERARRVFLFPRARS